MQSIAIITHNGPKKKAHAQSAMMVATRATMNAPHAPNSRTLDPPLVEVLVAPVPVDVDEPVATACTPKVVPVMT